MGYVGVNTRGMGDQLANGQRLIRDSRVVAFQRCIQLDFSSLQEENQDRSDTDHLGDRGQIIKKTSTGGLAFLGLTEIAILPSPIGIEG